MSSFEIQALLRLFKCNLVHGQKHLSNFTQAILFIQKFEFGSSWSLSDLETYDYAFR